MCTCISICYIFFLNLAREAFKYIHTYLECINMSLLNMRLNYRYIVPKINFLFLFSTF